MEISNLVSELKSDIDSPSTGATLSCNRQEIQLFLQLLSINSKTDKVSKVEALVGSITIESFHWRVPTQADTIYTADKEICSYSTN